MPKNRFSALWLSAVCILAFIIQLSFPGFTELFVLNKSALSGEIWRFISAIFLHSSLMHLVYNLFALLFFGLILEKFIGTKKFLFVFFVSGLFANIISVNFYSSSLGASGAVFGIIGCLTIIKPMMTVWAFSLPMPLFLASIFWLAGDLFGIFMPSNIANIAHITGLGFGLLFGLIFRGLKKRKADYLYNYKIKIPESYIREWEDKYMR